MKLKDLSKEQRENLERELTSTAKLPGAVILSDKELADKYDLDNSEIVRNLRRHLGVKKETTAKVLGTVVTGSSNSELLSQGDINRTLRNISNIELGGVAIKYLKDTEFKYYVLDKDGNEIDGFNTLEDFKKKYNYGPAKEWFEDRFKTVTEVEFRNGSYYDKDAQNYVLALNHKENINDAKNETIIINNKYDVIIECIKLIAINSDDSILTNTLLSKLQEIE